MFEQQPLSQFKGPSQYTSNSSKVIVLDKLEEVAEVNIGQPMLFTWVEAVREFLEERKKSQEKDAVREKSRIGIKEVDSIISA